MFRVEPAGDGVADGAADVAVDGTADAEAEGVAEPEGVPALMAPGTNVWPT